MLIKILVTAYYAKQDMKTPVRIGIIAMVSNIVMNLLLYKPLGHIGLALATSLSAALNAFLLYRGLKKTDVFRPSPGWGIWWLRLLAALGVMGAVIVYLLAPIPEWQSWTWLMRTTELLMVVGVAMFAFAVSLILLGLRKSDLQHNLDSQ